jgi:hypothetical protein
MTQALVDLAASASRQTLYSFSLRLEHYATQVIPAPHSVATDHGAFGDDGELIESWFSPLLRSATFRILGAGYKEACDLPGSSQS